MNKLRRWLHDNSARHQKNMSTALSLCEVAMMYKRTGQLKAGWEFLSIAIDDVASCGCPRDMWPPLVQELIVTVVTGEVNQ